MVNRTVAALVAATYLSLQCLPGPALAENQMGYRLLSAEQAAGLPRNGGALGMDIGRAQQIADGGLKTPLIFRSHRTSRGRLAVLPADGRIVRSAAVGDGLAWWG